MNCAQARSLLDSGITPGSQTPERAQLGFHLSQCSSCRAYSADLESRLLAALLSAPASAPGAIADLPVLPPPPPDPRVRAVAPYARGRSLFPTRAVVAAFVVAGLLIMLLAVGPELLRVIHIHQNVQAMTSDRPPAPSQSAMATAAPPTELPTATPRAATPTLLPSPTATLLPTATLVPTPAPHGPITIALLGIDQRPGETGGARSDAIIVVRIDPERGRVAMLSLPRDLYVDIPGYGYRRINSAMMYGRGDVAAGSALARDALAQTLGTPIDYTMTIDFQAFIAAIDSIGGVTVNVDRELYDSKFPTMDYGYAKVHFLPGEQHFDGATALIYSRIRHPDSDFARMKRQQIVLTAVLGRFREQGLHENLAQLEAVTTALRDYVHTDLPEDRLLGLAWALRDLEPAQIERYTLDQSLVTFGVGDDRWAEQAVDGAFEIVAHRLLDGDPEKKLR